MPTEPLKGLLPRVIGKDPQHHSGQGPDPAPPQWPLHSRRKPSEQHGADQRSLYKYNLVGPVGGAAAQTPSGFMSTYPANQVNGEAMQNGEAVHILSYPWKMNPGNFFFFHECRKGAGL